MPFVDPTSTVQDLIVKAARNGNDAIRAWARGTAELLEPFRISLYPPLASELLPDLPEVATSWFELGERLLREQKDLIVDLAELVQPVPAAVDGRTKKVASSASKAAVAA